MLTAKKIRGIRSRMSRVDERMAGFFAALADPGRLSIVLLLEQKQNLCVTEIAQILGITASAASQQLRILEMIGLARRERKGRMICHSLRRDDRQIRSLLKLF